ncbi:hypothetical protein HDU67_003996, partial [Dinochytrium kinnereticum]
NSAVDAVNDSTLRRSHSGSSASGGSSTPSPFPARTSSAPTTPLTIQPVPRNPSRTSSTTSTNSSSSSTNSTNLKRSTSPAPATPTAQTEVHLYPIPPPPPDLRNSEQALLEALIAPNARFFRKGPAVSLSRRNKPVRTPLARAAAVVLDEGLPKRRSTEPIRRVAVVSEAAPGASPLSGEEGEEGEGDGEEEEEEEEEVDEGLGSGVYENET